jgi:hypothetical protein
MTRRRHDVDADTDDHAFHLATRAGHRFEQDARDLGAVEQNVVGPLQRHLGARHQGRERIGHRQCRREAELRRLQRRDVGPQEKGNMEVPFRAFPDPPLPSAPGALPARPNGGPRDGAGAGQARGFGIGAVHDIIGEQRPARRHRRLAGGHRAMLRLERQVLGRCHVTIRATAIH